MRSPISWDQLWLHVAFLVAKRSKDPSTQCGVVLVSPDNRKIAIGYNGFAAGLPETDERWTRPLKYEFVIHSEQNALLNAKQDVKGWTCYVTMTPCHKCASLLVQAGIKRVIYVNDPNNPSAFNFELALQILKEGGIEVVKTNLMEVA